MKPLDGLIDIGLINQLLLLLRLQCAARDVSSPLVGAVIFAQTVPHICAAMNIIFTLVSLFFFGFYASQYAFNNMGAVSQHPLA